MATETQCRDKWREASRGFLRKIEEIDRETPWSTYGEPDWWLEMKEVQRSIVAILNRR